MAAVVAGQFRLKRKKVCFLNIFLLTPLFLPQKRNDMQFLLIYFELYILFLFCLALMYFSLALFILMPVPPHFYSYFWPVDNRWPYMGLWHYILGHNNIGFYILIMKNTVYDCKHNITGWFHVDPTGNTCPLWFYQSGK